jgi:hypothetical protein
MAQEIPAKLLRCGNFVSFLMVNADWPGTGDGVAVVPDLLQPGQEIDEGQAALDAHLPIFSRSM